VLIRRTLDPNTDTFVAQWLVSELFILALKAHHSSKSAALPGTQCNVRLYDPIHSSRIAAQTTDLSFTGCRICDVRETIEIDTIVWLEIQKGTESLTLWARVVRCTGENALGLAFLRARAEENSTLIRWIGEITSSTIASS
jgi:hypothetical protein